MTLSLSERRDWIRLARTPQIGPVSFWKLILRYGSATRALGNLNDHKRGLKPPSADQIDEELAQSDTVGARVLVASDSDYPPLLRALDPVPPLITIWGRLSLLQRPCIGIVGSRNASALGQKFTRKIAMELGEAGVTIVSGLARGIDAAAHYGSLETGTVGVLGGGVDHIYPRQNTELHYAMRERGLLVSESPLGYRATARDFPRRNRLISGLTRGIVVVEAAERSGTLITARYALEQNREVMAAPGSPLDPRTQGCNRLIRDGATLIQSASDILEVLESLPPLDEVEAAPRTQDSVPLLKPDEPKDAVPTPVADTPSNGTSLFEQISHTPTPKDDIIRASGLPTAQATAELMELQLLGDIIIDEDGRVCRNQV